MLKSMPPQDLIEGIREVHAGKKLIPPEVGSHLAEHMGEEGLTAREVEVLQQIAGGNRNQDIAQRLFISEETVKVHIKHIMEKLEASDRTQAVAIGIRRGIIQLSREALPDSPHSTVGPSAQIPLSRDSPAGRIR